MTANLMTPTMALGNLATSMVGDPWPLAEQLSSVCGGVGKANGPPKVWWRLVWCHERCHKQENEARCRAMREVTAELGASLITLKKAGQFGLWIERAQRPLYVLITDWREAQPCIQALEHHKGRNFPILTVVLCESPRQYSRASEWARRLTSNVGPVHVCDRNKIPQNLLAGLIHRFFYIPPPTAPGLNPTLICGADAVADDVGCATHHDEATLLLDECFKVSETTTEGAPSPEAVPATRLNPTGLSISDAVAEAVGYTPCYVYDEASLLLEECFKVSDATAGGALQAITVTL